MAEQQYIARDEDEHRVDIGQLIKHSYEEDDLLAHTQVLRLEVIKEARKKMADVPGYASLALAAAEGIDKQIINKRKLGVLSALAEQDEAARNILRSLSGQIEANPFKRGSVKTNANEVIKDDDLLPPPPDIPGIKEIGLSSLSYEGFMQEKGIAVEDDEDAT